MESIRNNSKAGFSLVEVTVMIAVMGIMAACAIVAFGNVTKASKQTIAQNLVETLNNATKEFGHAQYPLASTGENSDSDDEVLILQTLQWKDPSIELGVAGPFMRGNWIPSASSSTEDYRAVWSGSFWKVARPGELGAGLRIDFQAHDVGATFVHSTDFTPFPPSSDPVDVSLDGDGNPVIPPLPDIIF